VLFILFTTAAFLLAAVLAARPAPVLYPVAAVLCAAAVLAYAATRIIAFPELADDVGNWTEPLGMVSVAAELGVVLVSTVAARRTVHEVRAEHA
jgi:formate hydrogenlyase subunit 3/multisubunit Na+/H+ antiporter MnhD subunit